VARHLTPETRLELVVDVLVDTAAVNRSVHLEFDRFCRAPGVVRLRVEDQRAIAADDRWEFREAGGWDRDRSADPLRRVVRLAPRAPLPLGCAVHLVVPASFDERGRAESQRWQLATYGPFRLQAARCSWGGAVCPTGPITLHFTTPVRGADVLRAVALRPAVAFSVADSADVRSEWMLCWQLQPGRHRFRAVSSAGDSAEVTVSVE
jgi:hypothetical protein